MSFSAVILAGGQSSRMGRDKAFLEIGGQTLLARQIQTARAAGAAEVFISVRPDTDYSAFGLSVLTDKFLDVGPLAGIHAALIATKNPLMLALAVDLPEMTATFLTCLLARVVDGRGVIPRIAGQIEPLAAIYSNAAAELAGAMLTKKKYAVQAFARTCVGNTLADFAEFPAAAGCYFKNLNAPADLSCLT